MELFESGREDAVATLYNVLERDNSLSRCRAVRALEGLIPSDGEAVVRLAEFLTDDDPDVRMDCAGVLGRMGAAAAAGNLIDNLKFDPEGDVRIEAAGALAAIGGDAVVEPLIDCLRADGYPDLDMLTDDLEYRSSFEVQSRALSGLGDIGDVRATQSVLDLLNGDDYEDLQETGFRVLARLDGEVARDFLLCQLKGGGRLARRRAAQALGDTLGNGLPAADILDALIVALSDDEPAVRISAADALATSRSLQVVTAMARLLADPDDEVRRQAAVALAAMGGSDVAAQLHPLLDQSDPRRVRGIVEVLGEIADPASLQPLSLLLDSSHDDLRYMAVNALGRLALAGPEDKIAALLASATSSPPLRVQAAWALGCILPNIDDTDEAETADSERPDHHAILNAAVFDDNEGIALAALTAMVESDSENAAAMLTSLLRDDLVAPEPAAEPAAAEEWEEVTLDDDNPEGSTLASILAGHPEEEPLEEPADEPVAEAPPKVFGQAARVLAARLLGNLTAVGAESMAVLVDATAGGDNDLRREALLSLGRIGDDSALPAMLNAMVADDRDLRLAALEAVAGFAGTAYVQDRVLALLDDPDPFVRERAIELLGRVAPDVVPVRQLLADPELVVCRAALAILPGGNSDGDLSGQIIDLMFGFSGELRHDAGRALRRLGDGRAVTAVLAILDDAGREDVHWICIDALAEILALRPTETDVEGAAYAGAVG
jgi:HEAT repeat protein